MDKPIFSPDGKWLWDGSTWVPVPDETPSVVIPEGMPPTSTPTPSSEALLAAKSKTEQRASVSGSKPPWEDDTMDFKQLAGIIGSISLLIGAVFIFGVQVEYAVMDPVDNGFYDGIFMTCYDDEDDNYCSDKTEFSVPFILLGLTLLFYSNSGKIKQYFHDRTRSRAELELASGNTSQAMKYFRKIGDLEKVAECAELMQQNHTSEMTTVPVQQHVTSSIQPSLPSIQDSVVSGNIQYNINQSSAIQTGNDNASAGERAQRILTIISIVVTFLGIIAKIIQSAVG